MQILEMPIESLKRDDSQPRQTFDQERIEEMAQSIKTEGIINPIEIDSTNTIVTGEMRWRSAKLAGLATVPCKVISITPDERFRRQVIENIHHNTMSDWDTAKALQKLLRWHAARQPKNSPNDLGYRSLSKELGKSKTFIQMYMGILNAPEEIKTAIKDGKIVASVIGELGAVPKEFRDRVQQKIVANEFKTRDGIREVRSGLERNPEKAEEILAIDYSAYKTTKAVGDAVAKISPRFHEIVKERLKPGAEFLKITDDLITWLNKNPPEAIVNKDRFLVLLKMTVVVDYLNGWGKMASIPELKEGE